MQSNPAAEKIHAEKCREILIPLGFEEVRPSVFAQPKHPWYNFDVSAINPVPEVLVPYILDQVWDTAKQVGAEKQQKIIRDAIGLK